MLGSKEGIRKEKADRKRNDQMHLNEYNDFEKFYVSLTDASPPG